MKHLIITATIIASLFCVFSTKANTMEFGEGSLDTLLYYYSLSSRRAVFIPSGIAVETVNIRFKAELNDWPSKIKSEVLSNYGIKIEDINESLAIVSWDTDSKYKEIKKKLQAKPEAERSKAHVMVGGYLKFQYRVDDNENSPLHTIINKELEDLNNHWSEHHYDPRYRWISQG